MRNLWLFLAGACCALACSTPPTPAQVAQYDRVKCETVALEPLALSDADAIVHSLEDGLAIDDLFQLIADVKGNIQSVKAAVATCRAQFPKL